MPGSIRLGVIRYAAALVPAVALLFIAVLINAHHYETERARRVADRLDAPMRDKLDALLSEDVDGRVSRFVWLNENPQPQKAATTG